MGRQGSCMGQLNAEREGGERFWERREGDWWNGCAAGRGLERAANARCNAVRPTAAGATAGGARARGPSVAGEAAAAHKPRCACVRRTSTKSSPTTAKPLHLTWGSRGAACVLCLCATDMPTLRREPRARNGETDRRRFWREACKNTPCVKGLAVAGQEPTTPPTAQVSPHFLYDAADGTPPLERRGALHTTNTRMTVVWALRPQRRDNNVDGNRQTRAPR